VSIQDPTTKIIAIPIPAKMADHAQRRLLRQFATAKVNGLENGAKRGLINVCMEEAIWNKKLVLEDIAVLDIVLEKVAL